MKRFNYVGNKWVKSQKVVNFPFQNFDPTPYLASVPQETILRHRELQEHLGLEKKNLCNVDCTEELNEFDRENPLENGVVVNGIDGTASDTDDAVHSDKIEEKQPTNGNSLHESGPTKLNTVDELTEVELRHTNKDTNGSSSNLKKVKPVGRRKRLVSTSLTRTPVVDDQLNDYHDHHLKKDEDPFDLKYHLYAVVSHSGLLNGGHYVAYATNPNKSWYCYNDSSCREISQTQPNIDPSTAYLLFYERQGLDYVPYLPKIDGKQIPSVLEQDVDSDNDLKKMCVIS